MLKEDSRFNHNNKYSNNAVFMYSLDNSDNFINKVYNLKLFNFDKIY